MQKSVIALLLFLLLVAGCSTTKFVPQGDFLLDKISVKTDIAKITGRELEPFVKQQPNSDVLGLFKMKLQIYSLAGRDTTKSINRLIQRLGDAPEVYNPQKKELSEEEIRKAMRNRGYFRATVSSTVKQKKRKIAITYHVKADSCYRIKGYEIDLRNPNLEKIANKYIPKSIIKNNAPLTQVLLEEERTALAQELRNEGFYKVSKTNFFYSVDTLDREKPYEVDVSLRIQREMVDSVSTSYRIRNVIIHTNYDILDPSQSSKADTTIRSGYTIITPNKVWLKPVNVVNSCLIMPGTLYSDFANQVTYNNLNRLSAVKYVSIRYNEVNDKSHTLDCNIYISPAKNKVFSTEAEGTNSAGDFGAALNVNYQHLNLFKGSETLGIKVRGAYEYLSSLGSNSFFLEVGGEATLNFPRIVAPFINENFKKRTIASSELALTYNFQRRPEYTRVTAGSTWRYRWEPNNKIRHTFDLLDLSYTYLPYRSQAFIDAIEDNNIDPIVKYSYEDLFVLRSGYNFYVSNTDNVSMERKRLNAYTLRVNTELAGNLLYGLSHLFSTPESDGSYKLFGIRYAQYVKSTVDYTYKRLIDQKEEVVYHIGLGIAYPYGNLSIVPFERRYYSGGANSLRGWSVRTLGPGSYRSKNNLTDYINQSGDIKLDINFEYRTKLIWVLQGALFFDAGNIWTIREYQSQPGGLFKWDTFFSQIAMNYGVGLRFDLDFLIFRLDWGIKFYDPGMPKAERWRTSNLNLGTDSTLHFAIGYPF